MIKHQKPEAFYDTFERKGPGQKTTHYCPGCGHGTVHKLIGEALSDFDIADKAVFLAPVGCGVFIYYYFNSASIQCAHGRAPATGTAIKRVHDDSIVISYQGDGDLGGIGASEIVHAANRGENLTVIFINNAIYGMTGGQMAPTTLLGQKTKTTPFGRDKDIDGMPLRISELLNTMEAPVFIERTTLGTPKGVMNTRKAIRKAIQNQKDKKGFSFVEILAPCPINWKMTPVDARKWLRENLEKFYEVKNFRDKDGEKQSGKYPWMENAELLELLDIVKEKDKQTTRKTIKNGEEKVKIAGFGGQGIMSVGVLLSNCAIKKGMESTWLPSYGPEMRGGTANASVVIAEEQIGTPVVDYPDTLITMTIPALNTFEKNVNPGGLIIVNSSLINRKVQRDDVNVYYVPATELANKVGLTATAAVIMLGIYAQIKGIIDTDILKLILPQSLSKAKYVEINLKAIDAAEEYYKNNPL
ncbi:MAG: 2-oxoacid:acceptor oxidoreductase family protein [Victivallales bacterium]|nr:2-oxoacid:acceptor oxidoreductase family protein [Victivallales bacterium]